MKSSPKKKHALLVLGFGLGILAILLLQAYDEKPSRQPFSACNERWRRYRTAHDGFDHLSTPKQKYVARFNVIGGITYGGEGGTSATYIASTVRLLAEDPHNVGLCFSIQPYEYKQEKQPFEHDISTAMLVCEAFNDYREKTQSRPIIAYSRIWDSRNYLIFSSADKIVTSQDLQLPWSVYYDNVSPEHSATDRDDLDSLSDDAPEISQSCTEIIFGAHKRKPHPVDTTAIFFEAYEKPYHNILAINRPQASKSQWKASESCSHCSSHLLDSVNFYDDNEVPIEDCIEHGWVDLYLDEGNVEGHIENWFGTSCSFSFSPSLTPTSSYENTEPTVEVFFFSDAITPFDGYLADAFKALKGLKHAPNVVLAIDSPGGDVDMTEKMIRAIQAFKRKFPKSQIITCILNECASGAYVVAAHTDFIIGSESSKLGCIGLVTIGVPGLINIEQGKKNYDKVVKEIAKQRHHQAGRSVDDYKRQVIKTQARFYPAGRVVKGCSYTASGENPVFLDCVVEGVDPFGEALKMANPKGTRKIFYHELKPTRLQQAQG